MKSESDLFDEFVTVVRRLRKDCPWDSTQTHQSLAHLLIEEAYETTDSIENQNFDELKKELGDLLLHVVLHAIIAKEDNRFSLSEVLSSITAKLIRRHPHIFAATDVSSVDEVKQNWELIKMKEGRSSVLEGVPDSMPALLQAYRIQDKVSSLGFDWADRREVWAKIEEELAEFREAEGQSPDRAEEELGDLLFSLTNYARFIGLNPETALARTNRKFKSRFRHVENRMREENLPWKTTPLDVMDQFWNEAKKSESRLKS
ncbi:MAG: nucleoside triphosphate pyrophosphohydrolase [Bacteroidetes bacterium]|nr:nucleoside triphosphate pyrophosphohydrolase [Bacteroidota bacterium]